MSENITCSIKKSGKEESRNCAKGLLMKVMVRTGIAEKTYSGQSGYSVDEIEQAIYSNFPSREMYLAKIAKVALHLSIFTRTGRSSYTFQNAIYGRRSAPYSSEPDDYLTWLVSQATNEEIFPELYMSGRLVDEVDRKKFETYMQIEYDAILAGLNQIVRQCCDSKVCTLDDIELAYDSELFRPGTIFETTARSICTTRRINHWIPPSSEIFVPDSTPVELESPAVEDYSSDEDFESSLSRQNSYYQSAQSSEDINRNFDFSGQITCFNVDNLIHNLATLQPGKRLELPWNGELLDRGVQDQLLEKFKVEIGMRKYYLQTITSNSR